MMPHHQRMKGRQRPVDPSTVGLHDPSNLSSNVFKHRLARTDPRDASPGPALRRAVLFCAVGVAWDKNLNKWKSRCMDRGEKTHVGYL